MTADEPVREQPRFALNIADLTRLTPEWIAGTFLRDFCSTESPLIDTGPFIDDFAVALDGAAGHDRERLAAVLYFLNRRLNKPKMRVYERGKRGGWKRCDREMARAVISEGTA